MNNFGSEMEIGQSDWCYIIRRSVCTYVNSGIFQRVLFVLPRGVSRMSSWVGCRGVLPPNVSVVRTAANAGLSVEYRFLLCANGSIDSNMVT